MDLGGKVIGLGAQAEIMRAGAVAQVQGQRLVGHFGLFQNPVGRVAVALVHPAVAQPVVQRARAQLDRAAARQRQPVAPRRRHVAGGRRKLERVFGPFLGHDVDHPADGPAARDHRGRSPHHLYPFDPGRVDQDRLLVLAHDRDMARHIGQRAADAVGEKRDGAKKDGLFRRGFGVVVLRGCRPRKTDGQRKRRRGPEGRFESGCAGQLLPHSRVSVTLAGSGWRL